MLNAFVPLPITLVQPIVKALASLDGQKTLAAKIHILSKVSRTPGWQGLDLHEVQLSPKALAAILDCTAGYASRILQILKAEGWLRGTGADCVWAIVPDRVYETVAEAVTRKKSQSAVKGRSRVAVSTPIVIQDDGDTVPGCVDGGVVDGVMATIIKPNGSEGFGVPQESNFPEDKSSILFSPSSPSGGVCKKEDPCRQVNRETSPVPAEHTLAEAKEVMAAYNAVAKARGIPLLSEVDFKKLLPEILATISDPEGYPLLPAIEGMLKVPAKWFAKNQPGYEFRFLLERKARKSWTEKLDQNSSATSASPRSTERPRSSASKTGSGASAPEQSMEERLGPVATEGFRRFCDVYGNSDRIDRESDGIEAARAVAAGEVTWDRICTVAEAYAKSKPEPRFIKKMSTWLANKPWLLPLPPPFTKSTNSRQDSDSEFHEAITGGSPSGTASTTPEDENPLARMARENQNTFRT